VVAGLPPVALMTAQQNARKTRHSTAITEMTRTFTPVGVFFFGGCGGAAGWPGGYGLVRLGRWLGWMGH
jgi:hypothetical protein